MKITAPPLATWKLAVVVIAAQVAGLIVAFSVTDPCWCRKQIDELHAQLDHNAAELRAIYEDLAEKAQ